MKFQLDACAVGSNSVASQQMDMGEEHFQSFVLGLMHDSQIKAFAITKLIEVIDVKEI